MLFYEAVRGPRKCHLTTLAEWDHCRAQVESIPYKKLIFHHYVLVVSPLTTSYTPVSLLPSFGFHCSIHRLQQSHKEIIAMAENRLEVVLGAGNIGPSKYSDVESTRKYCEMFRPYGTRIDHARIYPADAPGQAEELMKAAGVGNNG
jgi:hypothetical protein